MTKKVWRIPAIYIILGVLWILLSDQLTDLLFADSELQSYSSFQTFKGLFFVLTTGAILFFLIRNFYKRLLNSETVYHAMFSQNPNPMWVYNPRTLKILEVNRAATEIYGYSEKEFLSMTIAEIRPKEDVSKLLSNIREDNRDYQISSPWRHKTKDGRVFFVRVYSNTIYRDSEMFRMVTAIDIDDMEKIKLQCQVLNNQLIDTSNYLRSLIDSQSAFLIRMDPKGNLIFGNQVFLDTFDYSTSTVQGKSYSEIFHNEDWRDFQRALVQCKRANGDISFLTLRSLTSNQEVIFTEWEFLGITDVDGQVSEIQGVGRNVTTAVKNRQELDRYKQYFGRILSSLNDVVFSVSVPELSLLFINESCEQVTQFSANEFLQKPNLWREIIEKKDRKKLENAVQEILQTEEEQKFECNIVTRDGKVKTLAYRIRLIFNERESRKELHGIFSDISDVKSAQQTIREYASEIEELLESITEGFFSVDREYRFEYINEGFDKNTGLNGSELIGSNLWNVFSSGASVLSENLKKVLEEDEKQSFEAYLPKFKKWFYFSAYPKSNGLSVYFEDITESHEVREEIQRSKELLSSIINSSSDLIWAVDKEFNLITANNVFFDTLAQPLKIGDCVLDEIKNHPEEWQHWKSLYEKCMADQSFTQEEEMLNATQGFRYLEIRFNPLRDDNGGVYGVSCFGRNITHHRTLEKQLVDQNKKLREIAHIQSHIVRSPVVNIQGLLKLLDKQDITSASNEEILRHMENAVKELDEIIHDIVERANTVERKVRESRENRLLS